MKTLIIGAGQVGQALRSNLEKAHDTHIRDVEPLYVPGVQVLHICYPDHDGFDATTRRYIDEYKPELTVINSSVRVGTTRKCGDGVIYSPTRGRHPNLAQEMKVFTKMIAGTDPAKLRQAEAYFRAADFQVIQSNNPNSLEFLKVMSNVHMGLEIAWRQEVERMMTTFGISSKDYDEWEGSYRNGLIVLADWNLIRPIMKPDPIGGHCVLPCTDLLRSQFESKLLDFIVESNERMKRETRKECAA